MTTYEEWRVTGTCSGYRIDKTFLPEEGYDEPEADARTFIARQAGNAGWTDGPHLHKRTVTVSEWTQVDA